ncbi:MAG: hypothetical protein I3273_04075 [Candidatus Moeniiplasma glomeromycotorum]|nr:hypothetical protein [Candidatus Moeniiplasma glomeromycotorum]
MESNKIKELIGKIRWELENNEEPENNISEFLNQIEELALEESEEEKKLYQELGISEISAENKEKKQVIKEIQRLAELKGIKVNFSEKKDGEIFLNLDQKDKQGNFCPNLVFWIFARELASSQPDNLSDTGKNPVFWKNFDKELEWVKQNLTSEYFSELENLTIPSLFPTEELEISEFLAVYYPNSEILDSQIIETAVRKEIVDKSWQIIREKILELASQVVNNLEEEKMKELAFKIQVDYNNNYKIIVWYHPKSPFQNQIRELVSNTPLQLENELLKKEKEQLPTPENFTKLEKQNKLLENYLENLTDGEKFREIKEEVEKIG